jgi:cytochrome c peroxidase
MTRTKIFIPSLALLGCLTAVAIVLMAGPRPSRQETAAPSAGAAQPAADEFTVGQRNKQFSQDRMTLKSGDKITFVNDDAVAHNIFVTGPGDKTRNSGVQEPGENATLVFDTPGSYEVECGIHPEMRMTVQVK